MLLETGRVVAVEADSVWVETIRQTTCGSCAAQKGCGHGIVNKVSEGRRNLIRVLPGKLSPQECAVDDEVSISIPESVILRGSVIVYMLPLLFMLAGAAASAAFFASSDIASALGAVLGFAVGFALVRLHAIRHQDDPSLQPELVALVHRHTEILSLS